MLKFFSVWGDWQEGYHSYEPNFSLGTANEITKENGYGQDDIKSIKNLKVGDVWFCPLGNHYIVRLPDNTKLYKSKKWTVRKSNDVPKPVITEVWYIKDNRGIASIGINMQQSQTSLRNHKSYFEERRGPGELLTKEVLLSDWEKGKITTLNIEKYKLP